MRTSRFSRLGVSGKCGLATVLILAAACVTFGALATVAQQFPDSAFQEMRWRNIGPYRGGRTRALAGVPSQPNVFYIGSVGGGVWKSDDFGDTWTPIFDDQDTGSIGAIAIAASDPNIIYVGCGEGLPRPDLAVGDGMYKSTDAGKTWTHLGLRDAQQIANIAIDPRDPNKLFVAVLGHPFGPNPERGIYRSTDGGSTFQKVLGRDDNTGGSDVEIDPSNPSVVYASLWSTRQGPVGRRQYLQRRRRRFSNPPMAATLSSRLRMACRKASFRWISPSRPAIPIASMPLLRQDAA